MDRYPWINISYQELIKYYTTGRGHYALLLHSDSDNGKNTLVYAFSCWLLCNQRNDDHSCGKCHSCKLMFSGTHPDYHMVILEPGKNAIGIDPIRQVMDKLNRHAQQGVAKVIWLSQAELLTDAATNALMKTLEEPPERTHFLLSCREPFRLLATLRSRCLFWHLSNPDKQISMAWLNHHMPGKEIDHLTALLLNNGSPIDAKKMLQPNNWQQRSILCNTLNTALLQKNMMLLLPVLQKIDVAERLYWLCTLLLDAMKWQQGASEYVVNHDQKSLVHQLASIMSDVFLSQILQRLLLCRHHLLSVVGVNCELLLIEQLLGWEEMLINISISPFSFL